MGWGRMLLLGNLGQQLDIDDTQAALREIDARLQESGRFDAATSRYLRELSRQHHELGLYYAALVRLLVAKTVVSREELVQLVSQVDGTDGKADGRLTGPVVP
jgi:hypothetical protein